jgi:hypothetical protein
MLMLGVVTAAIILALVGCSVEEGGGGTATPESPKMGMEAINEARAAGATPDCSKYPVWMACDPRAAPIAVKELP